MGERERRVANRDAAAKLLARLTGALGVAAVAAFGFLSWMAAMSNPGWTAKSATTLSVPNAVAQVPSVKRTHEGGDDFESDDGGYRLQAPSASPVAVSQPVVGASSQPAVVVTGGSHPAP